MKMTFGSKRARITRALVGLAATALLLAACAAGDEETAVAGDQPAEVAAESGMLTTVSGSQIDVNSLEGTDTILWYWAPW